MNKKYFFFLWLFIFFYNHPFCFALPDLTINESSIHFSETTTETNKPITISFDIENNGGLYSNPVPFSSFTYHSTYNVIRSTTEAWWAQYFLADINYNLNQISLPLGNAGDTDDIAVLQIREGDATKPNNGVSNYLANISFNLTEYTTSWITIDLDTPLTLVQGTTYWICIGCNSPLWDNGYRWLIGTNTNPDTLSGSKNQGESWPTVSSIPGEYSCYYKVFQTIETCIKVYDGNPDTTGILIASTTHENPITSAETETINVTWTPQSEGPHDIYVRIDPSNDIEESNEANNTAYKTFTVTDVNPIISSVYPADGTQGHTVSLTPYITFNKPLNASTISNNSVTLTAVKNNLGETINEPVSGTVNYNSVTYQVTFIPTTYFKNNYCYRLCASTEIKDIYGKPLTSAYTAYFTTVMNHSEENYCTNSDGKTKVHIPADAVTEESFFIVLDTNAEDTSIIERATTKITSGQIPFLYSLSNTVRSFTMYRSTYPGTVVSNVTFSKPVTITIPYTDIGDGTVSANNCLVNEEDCAIYYLNGTDFLWVKLPSSEVSVTDDYITAQTTHFSSFMIIAQQVSASDLSQAYAYPVPFKPNKDPTHTAIRFTGLSEHVTIKIFSLTGELVHKIISEDGLNVSWDARTAASGLYFYHIDNGLSEKKGKLLIVK